MFSNLSLNKTSYLFLSFFKSLSICTTSLFMQLLFLFHFVHSILFSLSCCFVIFSASFFNLILLLLLDTAYFYTKNSFFQQITIVCQSRLLLHVSTFSVNLAEIEEGHLRNPSNQWRLDELSFNEFLLSQSITSTLEPPYKRAPFSGSVDGVLGCGAWEERGRRCSRVRKSGSSVTTERAVSPVSCSGPRWWPCEL